METHDSEFKRILMNYLTPESKLNLLPKCPVCNKPILYSDTYHLWEGQRIHDDCFEKPTEDDLFDFIPKNDPFWVAVSEGRVKV